MPKIPLLLDKPINNIKNDKFGHEHYSELLYDLITNTELKNAYNIGVLGKWGVGKSSIKEMCKELLMRNNKENVLCIDFNAWKYGGDCIKKALLKHIYIKLGGTDDEIRDEFSRHITKQILELNKNNELMKNLRNIYFNWAQIILVPVLLFFGYKNILPLMGEFGKACATFSFAVLAGYIIKELLKNNNLLVPLFQNITKMDTPSTTAEAYEEFLNNQIIEYKEEHKNISKIVIFVDDLDRLPSSKEMIDCINAIRAFMDFDLPDNIGFIFVLSCCESKIADALLTINESPQDEDQIEKKIEAKRFLDKIFHFRIDIPPFPYQDMIAYSNSILKMQVPNIKEFKKILENNNTDLNTLLCRLIHPKVQEPRQAIQIINAFFQSWNIAEQREELANTGKAGGLSFGIVTSFPLTLATLSVLKVDFSYFYSYLLQEPKLLHYVLETIRTGKEPTFYIDSLVKNKFLLKDENRLSKLKDEYYDLKTYLNFINNKFELPKSLEPFLLLNQDPLSRNLGVDALEINDALINKNIQKLKKLLKIDEIGLTEDNAKLLQGLYEKSPYEPHKENIFYSIVQMASAITSETAFLIDSFADTLMYRRNYRELLSITDYEKILFSISDNKASKIISALEKSYMVKYDFSPEDSADDTEIFDKTYEDFKKSAYIKLKYYNLHQDKIKQDFIEWVANPTIGTFSDDEDNSKEEVCLKFDFTLNCLKQYSFLQKNISRHFLQAVMRYYKEISEIESSIEIDNDELLSAVNLSFDYLLKNNQDEFCNLFSEFLESDNENCIKIFLKFIKNNHLSFNGKIIDNFMNCYLWFLNNEINIQSNYIVLNEELEFCKEIIKSSLDKFSKNTLEELDKYIQSLTKQDSCTDLLIELLTFLYHKNKINFATETATIKEAFKEPSDTIHKNTLKEFFLNKYNILKSDNRKFCTENFSTIFLKNGVSCLNENNLNLLSLFVNKLIEKPVNNVTEINSFVDQAFYFINQQIISYNYITYFKQLFSNIKFLLKNSKNISLSVELCKICKNSNLNPSFINEMRDTWQKLSQKTWKDNNDAQEIFDYCIQNCNTIEMCSDIIKIYKSIKVLQTYENEKAMRSALYKYKDDLNNYAEFITQIPAPNYKVETFITFGQNVSFSEDAKNSLYKIWTHFIHNNLKDTVQITESILFQNEEWRLKVWLQILNEKKKSYNDFYKVLEQNATIDGIQKLLSKKDVIVNLLYGEDRKEAAKILLLASKDIFNSNIKNRELLTKEMLQLSYALYNDIIRDTKITGFSADHKIMISNIFQGKTFGRIKIKH